MLSPYIPIFIFCRHRDRFLRFHAAARLVGECRKTGEGQARRRTSAASSRRGRARPLQHPLLPVAMLFVIFDVETVFMFPWAVIFDELALFGLIEMIVFLFILVVGYFYAWKKGALEWALGRGPAPSESKGLLLQHWPRASLRAQHPSFTSVGTMSEPPNKPEAAGEKPAGEGQSEPLAGEASRAGAAPPKPVPAAAKPAAAGKPADAAKTTAPPSGPPDPPPPADIPLPPSFRRCRRRFPAPWRTSRYWVGRLDDRRAGIAVARRDAAPARYAPDALFDFCSDVTATTGRRGPSASMSSTACTRRRLRHRVRVKVRARDGQAVAVGDGHLAGGQLARARSLRHVRRSTSTDTRTGAGS